MTRHTQLQSRAKKLDEEQGDGPSTGRGRSRGRGRGGKGKGRGRGRTPVLKRPAAASSRTAKRAKSQAKEEWEDWEGQAGYDEDWAAWGTDDDWKGAWKSGWDDPAWAYDSAAWWAGQAALKELHEMEKERPTKRTKRPATTKNEKRNTEPPETEQRKQNKRKTKTEAAPQASSASAPGPSATGGRVENNEGKSAKPQPSKPSKRSRQTAESSFVKNSFPKTDDELNDQFKTFLEEVQGVQEDDSTRKLLRSMLSDTKEVSLTVYWTRPAVGLRLRGTTKDLSYISLGVDNPYSKTMLTGATLKAADLLASLQHFTHLYILILY